MMKTDVIVVDGLTRCDGCGKYPGTDPEPQEMKQVQIGMKLYFSCTACWPKLRILFLNGKIK